MLQKTKKSERFLIMELFRRIQAKFERGGNKDIIDYLAKLIREPDAFLPEQGFHDDYLKYIIESLQPIYIPLRILDFASGNGRLLAPLSTICSPSNAKGLSLSDVIYIGIEKDLERINTSISFIAENGLESRFNSVKFYSSIREMRRKTKYRHDDFPKFSYILIINALHEFPIDRLPGLLESLISLLKQGGHLIIQECSTLKEPERSFISWDMECIQRLFKFQSHKEPAFEVNQVLYESRTGIPVTHTKVTKCLNDNDTISRKDWEPHISRQVLPIMRHKIKRLMDLLEDEDLIIGHIYYNYAYNNINAYLRFRGHDDTGGKPPIIPGGSPVFGKGIRNRSMISIPPTVLF